MFKKKKKNTANQKCIPDHHIPATVAISIKKANNNGLMLNNLDFPLENTPLK